MGNSQACESRAPAPPTKKPGRVPWALLDSKRANARFSSEATREKSVEMDAVCAKLFPDGAEAKHAKSTVEGFSARLAQTAGSPSGWRTSMLAKLRFDPARGVAASVASAWSGGGCGAGVALWMPWLRQRAASGEGGVGGIADD